MSQADQEEPPTTDGRKDETCNIWVVKPSTLHGYGVFTVGELQEGDVMMSKLPIDNIVRAETRDPNNPDTLRYPSLDELSSFFEQRKFLPYGDSGTPKCYEDIHLLNHSCVPNAEAVWDPDTGRLVVRAICNIRAARAITIPYVSQLQPRAGRWSDLRFNCRCIACRLMGKALEVSDDIRKQLGNVLPMLRLYRLRFFGTTSDQLLVTAEAVRRIAGDSQAFALMSGRSVYNLRAMKKADFHSSGLMLIAEMEYVRAMVDAAAMTDIMRKAKTFKLAFSAKALVFKYLARIFGVEHPRSRWVLGRLLRMMDGIERAEEAQREMKSKINEMLDQYGWILEGDGVVQQGEEGSGHPIIGEGEAGQVVAGPKWDEQ